MTHPCSFSVAKNCTHYQEFIYYYPSMLVWDSQRFGAWCLNDASGCVDVMEFDIWHAQVCYWVPRSPWHHHSRTRYETSWFWARKRRMESCKTALGCSEGALLDFILNIHYSINPNRSSKMLRFSSLVNSLLITLPQMLPQLSLPWTKSMRFWLQIPSLQWHWV